MVLNRLSVHLLTEIRHLSVDITILFLHVLIVVLVSLAINRPTYTNGRSNCGPFCAVTQESVLCFATTCCICIASVKLNVWNLNVKPVSENKTTHKKTIFPSLVTNIAYSNPDSIFPETKLQPHLISYPP